ncbi:polyphosphate kinase 2, PA0141 family [Xenococcus sp. PCC 7305]|uniref:polyphosphate kinase 2 n=1 Tax=Xenococcus sp. PCC 7305 TaxID=102125 RepID=UPI0002AC6C77|nr:polyphosphate kinase 2 [Xenococcus sp. PCC 7305]ELS03646.1 polyphosphate kinase 2, PA0141 family [Xenococcus sp. PCC 7305]
MGKKKQGKQKNSEKLPRLSNKVYEAEITKLHAELVKLQYWVQEKGLKVIVVFEGRDAAGKGGVIKRLTERVSPRVFRVVALPTPSEREKTQMYIQRYMQHFPAAGEVVIFDRSWYNRAGVERVMGFCDKKEYVNFLQYVPGFEHYIKESGIILIKYWLDTSMKEQKRRFKQRIEDPRKVWKLSPMDLESYKRWYEYSQARDNMLLATDHDESPWYIVPADDKKRARLNCISHFLSLIPYEDLTPKKFELGDRDLTNEYDDELAMEELHVVPQKY